jgi:hypothetical protein
MDLPGDGVELNPDVHSSDLPQVQRQEIEEQGPIACGVNRYHLPPGLLVRLAENILKIGRLSAKTGSVVHNLALDFVFAEIDKRH